MKLITESCKKEKLLKVRCLLLWLVSDLGSRDVEPGSFTTSLWTASRRRWRHHRNRSEIPRAWMLSHTTKQHTETPPIKPRLRLPINSWLHSLRQSAKLTNMLFHGRTRRAYYVYLYCIVCSGITGWKLKMSRVHSYMVKFTLRTPTVVDRGISVLNHGLECIITHLGTYTTL